eukprot:m.94838 g.94838  ORF g.94838 m.94838 type:complete len:75 (-) comp12304_c0_seq2:1844-2068(-)
MAGVAPSAGGEAGAPTTPEADPAAADDVVDASMDADVILFAATDLDPVGNSPPQNSDPPLVIPGIRVRVCVLIV